MRPIRTFKVSPSLPPVLEPLRTLAYNLYWDWSDEVKELFRRLDPELWEESRHNPVLMLGTISQERLQAAAQDDGFLAHLERAQQEFETYRRERTWYERHRAHPQDCYAYFSAEFGLTTALPIYSGGLGVLAGDHLKSASDLGLPLVGVGLLYQQGYFQQYLTADGWQQERYPINDFYNLPLHLERRPDGSELRIEVIFPQRVVYARIWRVDVGRVPLYLLDTNIPPNNPYDQDITDQLYGGDIDVRIHQEIMLGIGGVKALRALGLQPSVYHMNEGHSAFLSLERMRELVQEKGLSFAAAREAVRASQVFTTHTPVPAGIDLFPPDKILYYLGRYREIFGLSEQEFLSLGREHTGDFQAPFNMAVFAMRMASFVNGVSQLHARVSRQMFCSLWGPTPESEVPIHAITNGVHARSCVAPATQNLYQRYIGPDWWALGTDAPEWQRVETIPDEELWRIHDRAKMQMILSIRERLRRALEERGASQAEIRKTREVLDPEALTIGFARRFATYKRATLILHSPERLLKLLSDRQRPIQFIFAGKAHPKDHPGKEMIREIVHFAKEHGLERQIVFVPNYDIHLSRLMVAGCDVWLNNPRRPREASGTSGMKAAMNGVPSLSTLDGWWAEADYVNTGWPIGRGEEYADTTLQDEIEANALYQILEEDVLPLYYQRDQEGLPREWIAKMKAAIRINTPRFNTERMVQEYAERAYFPVSDRWYQMAEQGYAKAQVLAEWKARVFQHWYEIKILDVTVDAPKEVRVNEPIQVTARINLGVLQPEEVQVQLYQGEVDASGLIPVGRVMPMTYQDRQADGSCRYTGEVRYATSGLQGFAVRILPQHPDLADPFELGLVHWSA
ncbi:MAG: alpha-glucan family phosphorylase [Gloeomargarita sp. SKYG116]|nr:alpha-glucan family phosphorylase [Gloeomargarita sp. SKYG116]MCS7225636.1 alpha-glucan family phosphorylase [Gloeomargarita sp. SKYB31]MDW8401161.1 alpha-glucan family phosphorylase [Gloeomargarita sp. SKYGB_i_bin116]